MTPPESPLRYLADQLHDLIVKLQGVMAELHRQARMDELKTEREFQEQIEHELNNREAR